MKKILAMFAVLFMMSAFNTANAAVYSDVSADYWANKEITAVVADNILTLKGNAFNPEKEVSRSDFNSALLRTLGHKSAELSDANPFSDVVSTRSDYGDILLSARLGLIYGYDDGTFKPDRIMTKAEAASVISHITKDFKGDISSLAPFKDSDTIPAWATQQYAKTIDLGVYVNYPNSDELLPNKNLNRAEAAVLLYKLKQQISAVKEQYVNKETLLDTEHLDVTKKAEVNEVQITNLRKIVLAKNIIKGYFYTYFTSKDVQVGDEVTFTAKHDIYTEEGTLVIPADTTMKATVASVEAKKWWNKNDKVTVEFESMTLPSGVCVPFKADVINNNGVLTENRWAKPVTYTVAGALIGGGAGVGVASFTGHHHYGNGVAIGTPVGAGLGLLTGLTTKGRTYKANDGDYVWLELTQDFSIPF
ncbi:MAG: S-layer homology domain-containing protein [Candidatus Gastranaerophilales bacterium]|nr:S-layer homology domain-containing protein [Candidatus Gastranaerophilales bacterium]